MSRDYLTTADVLGLHAILLERYGGASGHQGYGRCGVFRLSASMRLLRRYCGRGLCPDGKLVDQSSFCGWQQKDGIRRI